MGLSCSHNGKRQPKKAKRKGHEPKRENSNKSDRKCFVSGKPGHLAKDCDQDVRTMNEINTTAPVLTTVSATTEPGHLLSHVNEQNASLSDELIFALSVDTTIASRVWSSNSWLFQFVRFLHHFVQPRHSCHSESACRDVCYHLGSKIESYTYRSFKSRANYAVAPVVRPIL